MGTAVQSSTPGARASDSKPSPEHTNWGVVHSPNNKALCATNTRFAFIPLLSPTEANNPEFSHLITSLTPLFSLQWRGRNFSQKLFNLRKKELLTGLFSQSCPCFSTCFKLFPAITLLFMLIAACSSLFSGMFKRGCCYKKKRSFWRRCHLLHSLPHSSQLFRCCSNWLLLRDKNLLLFDLLLVWGYSSVWVL